MVINYKRLNDNKVDDAYNIPHKQEWINRIQGSKYFSIYIYITVATSGGDITTPVATDNHISNGLMMSSVYFYCDNQ
jgi:hypothetical protein